MQRLEFLNQFEVGYNNITSNQAPGLNPYEVSVFLTKAQDAVLKNHFMPQGNPKQAGFDDNQKRQADFSALMEVKESTPIPSSMSVKMHPNGKLYTFPNDLFIPINEELRGSKVLQVIPLRYDEFVRLMSKPYKRPLKNQAWRLITKGASPTSKIIEIVAGPEYDQMSSLKYCIRYIRRPKPIIVDNLDGLSINGYYLKNTSVPEDITNPIATDGECELDPILHEEILQRAVEMAKIAWTQNGQDNLQAVVQEGQRSE